MTVKTSVTIDGFSFEIEIDYNRFPTAIFSIDQLEYLSYQPKTITAIYRWLLRNRFIIRDIYAIAHRDVFVERMSNGVLGIVWLYDISVNHQDELVRHLASECIESANAHKAWEERMIARMAAPTRKQGHVYLAYSDTGHHKIGISKEPEGRIKVFDTQMPVSVSIVHSFPADNARKAEEKLHTRFSDKHHNGEWFLLDDSDVNYIRSIRVYENGKFKKG